MEITFASKLNLLTLHLRQILNNLCIFCILINVLFSTSKERNKKKTKRKPNILNYFNNYTYKYNYIYMCTQMNDFFDSSILFNAVDANRRKRKKWKKKPKKQKKYKTNTNLQWKLQASHTHTDSHTPYTELRIREFCIANTHTYIHKCTHTHTCKL